MELRLRWLDLILKCFMPPAAVRSWLVRRKVRRWDRAASVIQNTWKKWRVRFLNEHCECFFFYLSFWLLLLLLLALFTHFISPFNQVQSNQTDVEDLNSPVKQVQLWSLYTKKSPSLLIKQGVSFYSTETNVSVSSWNYNGYFNIWIYRSIA